MNEEDVFHYLEENIANNIISADPPTGSSRYPKISFLKEDGDKGCRYIPDMITLQDKSLVIIEIKPSYQHNDIKKLRNILDLDSEHIRDRVSRSDVNYILNTDIDIKNYFDNIVGAFAFSGSLPLNIPEDMILLNIQESKHSIYDNGEKLFM